MRSRTVKDLAPPPRVQEEDGGGIAEEGGSRKGGGGVSPDSPETTPQTELGQGTEWITLCFPGSAQGLPRTPRTREAGPGEGPDWKFQG